MDAIIATDPLVRWGLNETRSLPTKALAMIADPKIELGVTSASFFEMAAAIRTGNLAVDIDFGAYERDLRMQGFVLVPTTPREAAWAGGVKTTIKQPFLKLLAAAAIINDVPIVSGDTRLSDLGAERVWS
jgi:PIN domain nuclease of toxin-antitoxin system